MDRGAQQRRRTGARLPGEAARRGTTKRRWFATGKILAAGSKDRIDGTFDAVCRGGTAWRVGNGRSDRPAFSAEQPIWSPPFTAVLLRAEVFRQVGLLDPAFESYLEDVDFGLRCAAHGLAGIYVPDALAWHRGSATLGRWHPETVRRIARNQLFLLARHYPAPLLRRWLWAIAVAQTLWGGLAVRHGAAWAWRERRVAGAIRIWQCAQFLHAHSTPAAGEITGVERAIDPRSANGNGLRLLLEVVLFFDRWWGKVTHGGYRDRHRHL